MGDVDLGKGNMDLEIGDLDLEIGFPVNANSNQHWPNPFLPPALAI